MHDIQELAHKAGFLRLLSTHETDLSSFSNDSALIAITNPH